jgi:predicted nucleic acid-binding protein
VTRLAYVDASALVKLIMPEEESGALHRWYVEAERLITSRAGMVETERATRRRPHDENQRMLILRGVEILEVDAGIGRVAGSVEPPTVRTLDAIHVASALALGPELEAFVTYDDRLANAARAIGLPVVRPA